MLVYLVTNKINGKKYVGQTIQSLEERWRTHTKLSANLSKVSPYLYNAIRKHSVENFEIRTLIIVDSKEWMDYYERKFIQILDLRNPEKGYNLTDGGDGVLGLQHSEKSNLKNRLAHLGKKLSEEHKKKIAKSSLGRKHSEETKQRMSAHVKSDEHRKKISLAKMGNKSRTGMKASEEEIQKRSASLLDRPLSEEHKQKLRFGSHRRYHVSKNIINPKCLLCREGSNSNVIPQ